MKSTRQGMRPLEVLNVLIPQQLLQPSLLVALRLMLRESNLRIRIGMSKPNIVNLVSILALLSALTCRKKQFGRPLWAVARAM